MKRYDPICSKIHCQSFRVLYISQDLRKFVSCDEIIVEPVITYTLPRRRVGNRSSFLQDREAGTGFPKCKLIFGFYYNCSEPRMRNELRDYEPKMARKWTSCVSPISSSLPLKCYTCVTFGVQKISLENPVTVRVHRHSFPDFPLQKK